MKITITTTLLLCIILINNILTFSDENSQEPHIKDVKGSVSIQENDSSEFSPALPDQILKSENILKTGAESYVDVQFDIMNVFRLLPDSHMRVDTLPDAVKTESNVTRLYSFSLLKGDLSAKLDKLPQDTRFEIQTPVAIAGARGTAYSVSVSPSGTTVAGYENEVHVVSKDIAKKSVIVSPDRRVFSQRWDSLSMRETGTGILSESILGKMVKESIDTVSIRATGNSLKIPDNDSMPFDFELAKKQARAAAEDELAAIVSETYVDAETKITDLLFKDTTLAGKLFELISNAKTVETTQKDDRSVSVTIELSASAIISLINKTINVWTSVRQISRAEYMQKFPALARVTTERAAKIDGYRRLAERIYGTVLSSETTLKDLTVQNDTIINTVQGLVQGARSVQTTYFSDGSITVTMEIDGTLIRDRVGPASGADLGETYLSSPESIRYRDYKMYKSLQDIAE
ncbi:MAG: FecR domain-containing protein [Candidatus Auribacterota bacterium]